jgi:hypothetical protein
MNSIGLVNIELEKYYNNSYCYIISKQKFNNLQDAKIFKKSLTLEMQEIFDIIPIQSEIYDVLLNLYSDSESFCDLIISRYNPSTELEKTFTLQKVKLETSYGISFRQFDNESDATIFLQELQRVYPTTNFFIKKRG